MAQQKVRSLGSQWVDAHWKELEHDHPNEWVAADDSGLIAHDPSYDVLLQKVAKRTGRTGEVTHAFIPAGALQ